MKIVAKTGGGYLVEMNEDEIASAAGCHSTYSEAWLKLNKSQREPQIGLVVEFRAALDFHARIEMRQEEAKKAAATLRALAGLLDGAMPVVVIPPLPAPAAPETSA